MNAREALKMAGLALDVLDTIQKLTHFGGDGATAALATISHLAGLVQAGAAGKATAADIEHELALLRARLDANDSKADAAVDAKFDHGDK